MSWFASQLDADLVRCVSRLRARLVAGAATHRDVSFNRPGAELVDEVQQELEDVSGWSLILWVRLERLRERIDASATGLDPGDRAGGGS